VVHAVISNLDQAMNGRQTESEESQAREALTHLNERVAELVTQRKKELEQGIVESHLRNSLAVVKSVNDQYNFIWKISEDLRKIVN